jgi:ribosome maturation protein Sdo1
MSKKTSDSGKSAIEKLLAEGTMTLTANSREEIYEQAEALVATIPGDTKWTRTIVEHNAGIFKQTYSIIKD